MGRGRKARRAKRIANRKWITNSKPALCIVASSRPPTSPPETLRVTMWAGLHESVSGGDAGGATRSVAGRSWREIPFPPQLPKSSFLLLASLANYSALRVPHSAFPVPCSVFRVLYSAFAICSIRPSLTPRLF